MLLNEMKGKYRRQVQEVMDNITRDLHTRDRKILFSHMRKKRIIVHYINQCDSKLEVILQKKYALEQLSITAMQIEAMKKTANVFKKFNRDHNIEKLEQLQDTVTGLQDDIMEIDSVLATDTMDFDEDELERELNSLMNKPAIVATFPVFQMPTVPEHDVKARLLPERTIGPVLLGGP